MIGIKLNLMKNKVYSLVNQVLASGFSFLIIIVSSRLLSPDEFGVISLIIMISMLVSVIPQSFITMPIMSNSFKEKDRNKYYYHNTIILIIFLLFVSVVFLLFYYNNCCNIQNYFSFYSILIYFSIFQIYELLKKIMFVKNTHNHVVAFEFLKLSASSVTLLLFFYYNRYIGIDQILFSISFGYFLFSVSTLKNIKPHNFSLLYLKKVISNNYKFGKWIFVSNVIQNINSNFYMYVAALLLPLSMIGALNAVRSLIGFSTVIFLALDNYLTPKYAQLYLKKGKHELQKIIAGTYTKIGILLIALYFLIALFSEKILDLVYGKQYEQYAYFLYVFLVANIFMFYTRPILILAKTIGVTKILFLASLPTLIFTVLITYTSIDLFQVNGALFIMLSSQLIHLLSLLFFYKKEMLKTKEVVKGEMEEIC